MVSYQTYIYIYIYIYIQQGRSPVRNWAGGQINRDALAHCSSSRNLPALCLKPSVLEWTECNNHSGQGVLNTCRANHTSAYAHAHILRVCVPVPRTETVVVFPPKRLPHWKQEAFTVDMCVHICVYIYIYILHNTYIYIYIHICGRKTDKHITHNTPCTLRDTSDALYATRCVNAHHSGIVQYRGVSYRDTGHRIKSSPPTAT